MAGEISVGENSWENSARGKHWFGKKWLGEFQQGETSGEIMAGRYQLLATYRLRLPQYYQLEKMNIWSLEAFFEE